jgi:hypothetical protein
MTSHGTQASEQTEETIMKALNFTNTLALGAALLLATTAFAAEKGSMKLFDPAVVGGVQLAPGDYNVTWEGTGPNVELKIAKGNKVVATAPAHTFEMKSVPPSDGTTTKANAEGKTVVSEIFFRGKTRAFAIAPDATQAPAIAQSK